jgi:hypothetical protein
MTQTFLTPTKSRGLAIPIDPSFLAGVFVFFTKTMTKKFVNIHEKEPLLFTKSISAKVKNLYLYL